METNFSTLKEVLPQTFVENQAENFQVKTGETCIEPNYSKNESESEENNAGESSLYVPHWIIGGAKHPGLIVETPGLANVVPPPIFYRPKLPQNLSEESLGNNIVDSSTFIC